LECIYCNICSPKALNTHPDHAITITGRVGHRSDRGDGGVDQTNEFDTIIS